MKRIITFLSIGFFLATAATLSAAYQYGDFVNFDNTSLNMTQSENISLNFISDISSWDVMTVTTTDLSGNTSSRTVEISGANVNLGSFQAGDKLTFAFSGTKGEITKSQIWGDGWDNSANMHDRLVIGGNYGVWGERYDSFSFRIEGSSTPIGQPLPGVLAILLTAGTGRIILKRRGLSLKK